MPVHICIVSQLAECDRCVNMVLMCWLLFQSPDCAPAAVMPPPPYYAVASRSNVVRTSQYPDDLDDDDTDWDQLL